MKRFSISIPKEQLAAMPVVAFGGEITVVDTPEAVAEAIDYLNRCPIVGFDTETKPSFRKGMTNTVSLIQISDDTRAFLFRINRTGFSEPIRRFLENPDVVKVGLSLKDDFHVLHRVAPFAPASFVELQEMVRDYNIADSSLQKIYGIIFGGRISKSQRLSNWEAESLAPGQRAYAALDAWACLHIYRQLMSGAFIPSQSPYIVHENK